MIGTIWVFFLLIALLFGTLTGQLSAVSQAVATGSAQAVTLLFEISGFMIFWSGILEIFRASGGAKLIEKALHPVLKPIFGSAAQNRDSMQLVSANITANMLGLSNAATPIGLQAGQSLQQSLPKKAQSDAILTLIALNTTSIQLIPSTVAALRVSAGSTQPFAVMPAVWCASAMSVAVVLLSCHILRRFFP